MEKIKNCKYHGRTRFVLRTSGRWRCRKCASEAVTRRRQKVKRILVEEAGGKCTRCGYSKCIAALVFHHKDSKKKDFGISGSIIHGIEKMRREVKKCELLCHNCHTEIHSGSLA